MAIRREELQSYHNKDHWFQIKPVDQHTEVQVWLFIEFSVKLISNTCVGLCVSLYYVMRFLCKTTSLWWHTTFLKMLHTVGIFYTKMQSCPETAELNGNLLPSIKGIYSLENIFHNYYLAEDTIFLISIWIIFISQNDVLRPLLTFYFKPKVFLLFFFNFKCSSLDHYKK